MARFRFDGIDGLAADLEALAHVDAAVKYSILEAGAEALKAAWQAVLRRLGLINPDMPQLINSLSAIRKSDDGEVLVRLMPKGKRKRARQSRRMKRKDGKRRSAGNYGNTNAEVGYILEYGTPRIPAKHWMERGNAEGEEDCVAAEQEAWNRYLAEFDF